MSLQRTEIDGRPCFVGQVSPTMDKIVFDDGEIVFSPKPVKTKGQGFLDAEKGYAEVEKYNEAHDAQGRFASAGGGSSDTERSFQTSMNLKLPNDEQFLHWQEEDGKVVAFHGTRKEVLDKIMKEGIHVVPDQNYPRVFYRGDRGQSIFVSSDRKTALNFADKFGLNALVLELRIPKEEWAKFHPDRGVQPNLGRYPGDAERPPEQAVAAYAPITVPPAWIKEVIDPQQAAIDLANDWNKRAEDEDYVTVYMVISVDDKTEKYNEEHDERGRFASASGGSGGAEQPSDHRFAASRALTTEEKDGIQYYTKTTGYKQINDALRRGFSMANSPQSQAHFENLTKAIDSRTLTEPITVYRGTDSDELVASFERALAGGPTEFTDKGFASTSMNQSVSENYSRHGFPDRIPNITRITVPKGAHALAPTAEGGLGFASSAEVILQHGSRFRVTGKHTDPNGSNVYDVSLVI